MTPWDTRLARLMVRPLAGTFVRPNHITVLSLISGTVGAALIGSGDVLWMNWGALLYMLAALFDHADGELARMTGTSSRFGFLFDQAVGAFLYTILFLGIGFGLRNGPLGTTAIWMGGVATLAVGIILAIRFVEEMHGGKEAVAQPALAGFEVEDIMYLIGPLTWWGGLKPFLMLASVGAPIAALVVVVLALRAKHQHRQAGA